LERRRGTGRTKPLGRKRGGSATAQKANQMTLHGQPEAMKETQQQQQQKRQETLLIQPLNQPFALHNLVPPHLQSSLLHDQANVALRGTPGHLPALIQPPSIFPTSPPLAIPSASPAYNGVNLQYPNLRVLSHSPPMYAVDDFLTPQECQFLIQNAQDSFGPAPVVGKGVGEVSPSRTSSTCYLAREDLPDVLRKVSMLTNKPVQHCELPQVGRYFPTQQYLQHYDAFDLTSEDGRRFAANGGQRTVTVLIYLNDVFQGGATRFPMLHLQVQPKQGTALVFFPATVDGTLDPMALHAALPAIDTKYVSQIWIRQGVYTGHPSKRLAQPLGMPFGTQAMDVHLPGSPGVAPMVMQPAVMVQPPVLAQQPVLPQQSALLAPVLPVVQSPLQTALQQVLGAQQQQIALQASLPQAVVNPLPTAPEQQGELMDEK